MNAPAAAYAPGTAVMAASAAALARVVDQGVTAEEALLKVDPPAAQRAAVRAILAGSLRWYLRLLPAVDSLLTVPGRRPQPLLHALLVVAAHQVEYSRGPAESAANIAVDAARALGFPGATGFVNAVLRRLVREREAIFAAVDRRPAAAVAHPRWLVQALESAYGERAADLLAANNEHPPLTLRVDLTRGTREECIATLAAAGHEATAGLVPSAVVLQEPVGVDALPGFAAGRVSVQDAGAQVAAWLLDAQPGERVLDACAAPGGKTGAVLERARGELELTAVDVDPARVALIADNLQRLGFAARLVSADLAASPDWWDGRPFDRILLDAPCSATGVIRRHPDIKLLRRAADLAALSARQRELLARCFGMLAPGGRLLYCTCSVLPEENAAVVARFLSEEPRAREVALEAIRGELGTAPSGTIPQRAGLQILPSAGTGTDGFYYACLTRG